MLGMPGHGAPPDYFAVVGKGRNAWVHLQNGTWKKLSNRTDSGILALTVLSAHAKQTQTAYSYRKEADGMVHEVYVW